MMCRRSSRSTELPRKAMGKATKLAEYEYAKRVIARVDRFPKNHRFILGQRLVDGVLEIHECLVEGAYSRGARKRDQLEIGRAHV